MTFFRSFTSICFVTKSSISYFYPLINTHHNNSPIGKFKIHYNYEYIYFRFGILLYVVKESPLLTYVIIKKINVTLIIDMKTTTICKLCEDDVLRNSMACYVICFKNIISFDRFICVLTLVAKLTNEPV